MIVHPRPTSPSLHENVGDHASDHENFNLLRTSRGSENEVHVDISEEYQSEESTELKGVVKEKSE